MAITSFGTSFDDSEDATTLPRPTGTGWHEVAQLTAAASHLRNTQPDQARVLAEAAGKLMHTFPADRWDSTAVECLYLVGDLRFRTSAPAEAVEVLLEALDLIGSINWAGTVGDARPAAEISQTLAHHVHARLSTVYCNLGLYSFALSESHAALAIADQLDDPSMQAWTWSDITLIRLSVGDPPGALDAAQRAVDAGSRQGADPVRLGIAHIYGLLANSRSDALIQAAHHAACAHALIDRLPAAERAGLHIACGELAMRTGDVEQADRDFALALAEVEPSGERFVRFGALTGKAGARLVQGDYAAVQATVTEALALGDGTVALTLLCERMMAQALEQMGDLAGALVWQKRAHLSDRRQLQSNSDERLHLLDLEHRAALAERQAEADRARAERAEDQRRVSAAHYEAMIQESADLVLVVDEDTTVRWVSSACESILGITPEDFIGRRPLDVLVHDDPNIPMFGFLQAMQHPGIPSTPFEYRVRHGDGSWRYLAAAITDLRHDPGVGGLMFVGTDNTRHRWNEALVLSQTTVLDLIARAAPLATVLARLCEAMEDLCDPMVTAHIRWMTEDETDLELPEGLERRLRLPDPSGRTIAELVAVIADTRPLTDAEESALDRMMQLAQIATERSTAATSLAHQATHDHLTGLPNRLHFEQLTAAAVNARADDDDPLAVLFLDLDRFKLVNDSLGHGVGDRLLVEVTDRIRACLGPDDVAARFGGDEFTVLRPVVWDLSDLVGLAEGLIEAIRRPFVLDAVELCLSVSIGITMCRERDAPASTLIAEADSAMFRAKEQGRDRSELFDHGMRLAAEDRLRRGSALRHALPRHELRLDFQPIVDLRTGQTSGHEALLRWHSAELGLVAPNHFIPLAEETGLIIPIGAWVIAQAIDALAAQDRPGQMWINLSAQQLTHPSLLATVSSALAASGADPSLVCFEITETALTTELDTALDRLAALRSIGASIAIDDFGTGYSSLDRLQSLPVQVLKVDRSFVAGVDGSDRRRALLDAILDLSDSLGMRSVAEGVETAGELRCLLAAGCDMAQGYLLARPAPQPIPGRVYALDELSGTIEVLAD